jgi:quercetin dioxygenase-like cupin family protein
MVGAGHQKICAAPTVPQAAHNPASAGKVEVDNHQVRVVLRSRAPHEKVPIHSHPDGVVVYLTEVRELSTDPTRW